MFERRPDWLHASTAFAVLVVVFLGAASCNIRDAARRSASASRSHRQAPTGAGTSQEYRGDTLPEAERRARVRPHDPDARFELGILYQRAGRLPDAARELRAAERLAPDNPAPAEKLAEIYRAAGYEDREIDALEAAIRAAPADMTARLRLADLFIELGWLGQARTQLSAAEKIDRNSPELLLAESSHAVMRHQFDEMREIAQRGVTLHPESDTLHFALSEALRLQGHLKEAEGDLKRAASLAPTDRARARYQLALAHLLLDDKWWPTRYSEAGRAAARALQLDPGGWQAHYWLGRALALQGKNDQAMEQYEETARHDVQFEAVAYQLGRLYQRSVDPSKRAEGTRLLKLSAEAQQNQRAYGAARATMTAHPSDPDAHLNVARWYLLMSDYPHAIVELRRVLGLRPSDRAAALLLASTLKAAGRTSEAKMIASRLPTASPAR